MSAAATIAFGSLQVLIAVLARVSLGSWLSPGAFFSGFWALFGTGAALLAVVAFDGAVRPAAIAAIAGFSVAVWTGDEIGRRWRRVSCIVAGTTELGVQAQSWYRSLTLMLSLLALLVPVRLLQDLGWAVTDALSLSGWFLLASDINYARYHGQYTEPLDVRLLLTGLYFAALLGGTLLSHAKQKRDVCLAWVPTTTGVAIAAVTTTKSTFLLPLIMTTATYLASNVGQQRSRTWAEVAGVISRLLIACGLLAGAFVGTMMVRYSQLDFGDLALIGERLSSYVVGHVTAFSAWGELEGYFSNCKLSWGAYTFVGLHALIAGAERIPGIYEVLVYNDYVGDSNVYTVFRGLVSDFAMPGAVFVLTVVGAMAGWHFTQLRVRRMGTVSTVVVSCFYLFTLWSHVVNVFAYNTVVAAVVCWWVLLGVLRRSASEGRAKSEVRALP